MVTIVWPNGSDPFCTKKDPGNESKAKRWQNPLDSQTLIRSWYVDNLQLTLIWMYRMYKTIHECSIKKLMKWASVWDTDSPISLFNNSALALRPNIYIYNGPIIGHRNTSLCTEAFKIISFCKLLSSSSPCQMFHWL